MIKYYVRALTIAPSDASFAVNRIASLRRAGRAEEAVSYGEQWLASGYEASDYFWNEMGLAAGANAEHEGAAEYFNRALAIAPSDASFAGNRIVSLRSAGRAEEALSYGEQWLASGYKANAYFRNQLAIAANANAEYDRAIEYYDQALAIAPSDASFAANRIALLKNAGKATEAVSYGEQWLSYGYEAGAIFWTRMGLAAYAIAEYERAVEYFGRALTIAPSDESFAGNLIASLKDAGRAAEALSFGKQWLDAGHVAADHSFWTQMGDAAYANTKYEHAIEYYNRALTIAPSNVSLAFNKIISLKNAGRVAEAMAYGEEWLASGYQANAAFWNLMGVAANSNAEYKRAIEYYDRALTISPSDATTAGNRIVSLRKAGRAAEAVHYGEQWLASGYQADAAFWNLMGVAANANAEYERALEYYDRALTISPSNVSFAGNRISALKDAGRASEALSYGEEWLASGYKADADFWNYLGLAAYATSAYERAVECFYRALTISPSDAAFAGNRIVSLTNARRAAEAVSFGEQWLNEGHEANEYFWEHLTNAAFSCGEYARVTEYCDRVLSLSPSNEKFVLKRSQAELEQLLRSTGGQSLE
jgi:tetratricopeptide (TPR) repeat protein